MPNGFTTFNPLLNQNIKSISPDGTITFFDDSPLLQGLMAGQTPFSITPGQQAVQQTGKPTTGKAATPPTPNAGEGFLQSPAFPLLLAKLGQAFTASAPQSPAFQLGGTIAGRAQNQLFNKLLNNLLRQAVAGGAAAQGPNVPVASLAPFEAAGIPAQAQLEASRFAQDVIRSRSETELAQQALALQTLLGAREIRSADFQDLLNQARAIALLTPEPPNPPGFERVELNIGPDGKRTPPEDKHLWYINKQTGEREIYLGPSTRAKPAGAEKAPPSQKPSTVNLFRETLITQFSDALQEGLDKVGGTIDPKSGKKIVSAAQLLSLLRDPLSGFDITTAESILANVPDAFADYNARLESALQQVDTGKNIGTILRELRSQTFLREKETIPGFGGK